MHPITNYIEKLKAVLDQLPTQRIEELIAILIYARAHGNKIFFMGNGGSGATASHFATDLGKGTLVPDKPPFKVMPLNDHMPTFSAFANDLGYETVFAEQLKMFVERGDVVIGLSGSGKSRNVLRAMEVAREAGGILVGFTGFDGGLLKDIVDLSLHAPVNHMGQSEDAHHVMMHLICDCIRHQVPEQQYALPSWAAQEEWGLRVRR